MGLSDLISLHRVTLVEETSNLYRVKYADITYEIAKSSECSWENTMGALAPTMELRLEHRLLPVHEINQDEAVPSEFKEVMMFHEIREGEYSARGFNDAHARAVNDELLYVLKFFDRQKRERYIRFAKNYRDSQVAKKSTTGQEAPLPKKRLFRLQFGDPIVGYFGANLITTDPILAAELEYRGYGCSFGGKEFEDLSENDLLFENAKSFGIPFIFMDKNPDALSYAQKKESVTTHIGYDNGNYYEKVNEVCRLIDQLLVNSGKKPPKNDERR